MKAVFHHNQLAHFPTRYLQRGHIVEFPEQPTNANSPMDSVVANKTGIVNFIFIVSLQGK